MKKLSIDDVDLVLTEPVDQEVRWIGQDELIEQVLASWLVVDEADLPLCPRLIGKPGVGKTTLGQAAARAIDADVYIQQCTMDTRPEDLLVTPVLAQSGQISYHASPLVSAMVRGGVVILDEANRMSEKSWASLAPLLDHRRYVDSVVAGVRIEASPEFRACVTMNDDASTFEVPDYMLSRIQPTVQVEFPEREDELRILKYHLPFAPREIVELTVDFLQGGHQFGLPYSTRDGINIMRFALKTHTQAAKKKGQRSASSKTRKRSTSTEADWKATFDAAVRAVLGPDAHDFEKHALKQEVPSYLDLREFFDTLKEVDDEEHDGDETTGS